MSGNSNRLETWATRVVLLVALVAAVIIALPTYMKATAAPLHPEPEKAPSVTWSSPSSRWSEAVRRSQRAMRTALTEQNLPGLSVAVGVGPDVVWSEGFGWADIETHARVTPETRFRIGTASNVLTSAAVGALMEKDRLKLDQAIQAYVPQFPKKKWPVTLRQVMAHTAGIPSDGGDEGPLFGQHCDRPVDALPFFADRDLRFEPGTQYSYSRFGYILVSAAIEKAGDDPFVIFMQKHIFDPLGMNDTLPDSMTEPIPDRSISYFPRFAGDPKYGPDVMRDLDLSCYSGSSIFLSTASDMVRFTLAIDNGKLLQPATVRQLQMSQELRSGEKTGYGLGWDLDEVKTSGGEPINVIGHDGDLLGGVAGSIVTVPSHGNVVVAVFSNTSYADTALLAASIAEVFGHPKK